MKRTMLHSLAPALLIGSFACSSNDDASDDDVGQGPPQCQASGYVAFDPANHMPQDLRLGAFEDMTELMDAAVDDPALASGNYTQVLALYEDTASFREKVQGRVDDHLASKPNVGMALDQYIVDAIEEGRTATTGFALDIAKEKVEKTLLHFFFLSVFHEMVEGERATWDEAYGYWGANSNNVDVDRRGLAELATARDATNNTNLADTVFNGLVDGSCELAKALDAAGGDSLDYKTVPPLKSIVEETDLDMQEVLAYSAAHEAFEMVEQQEALPDPEASAELEVELLELDLFFQPLEPLMIDRGGESAARAARIRSAIDAAATDATGAWKATFDPNAVITDLEDEYSIDVRG